MNDWHGEWEWEGGNKEEGCSWVGKERKGKEMKDAKWQESMSNTWKSHVI